MPEVSERPTCGICGKVMTPENSRLHPEYFVCDECAPRNVCDELKCKHKSKAQLRQGAGAGPVCPECGKSNLQWGDDGWMSVFCVDCEANVEFESLADLAQFFPSQERWVSASGMTLPDEDEAVLIAVMNEAENHGTGEFVRFPDVGRGTLYSVGEQRYADTDIGEYKNDEILGWQPLPKPPELLGEKEKR